MPSLRTATPDDADTLARLERDATMIALEHVFGSDRPFPIDDIRVRWMIVLDDPDTTTLLTYEGDRPIGYAAFDSVELRHFGIHHDRFGTGLADDLHAEFLRRTAVAGVEVVRLWVLADNVRARRFYERNGWVPDGRVGTSEFPPHPKQLGYARVVEVTGDGAV